MKTLILALCLCITLMGVAGCSDGTSSDPIPAGTLYGFANLSSPDHPSPNITDHSGIKVTLEGTPFTAVTDVQGRWEMTNVPTRTYTVVYEKEGFGSMKEYGVVFVGGGHVGPLTMGLYEIPECGATLDQVTEERDGVILATAHSDCPYVESDYAIFYFSHSPTVSKDDHVVAKRGALRRDDDFIEVELHSYDNYYFQDLDKSKTIYVVAYHGVGGGYYDPVLDKQVYTAIHPEPSEVKSIQLR